MSNVLSSIKSIFSRYSHINWALFDQVMVSGVNFLTGILIARYLGLEEYGRFALAWMAVLFFNSFQQAGIIAPMMCFGPLQVVEDEPAYYGAVVLQQLVWSLLCFVFLWTGVVLSEWVVPQWGVQDLGLPLAIALLAWELQDFLRRYFFVRGQGQLAFINDAISYLGQLIILAALFRWSRVETAGVLWLIALTSAVAVLAGACTMGPLRFSRKRLHIVTAQHWGNSKWLVGSALIQWTSGNFFIVSLGAIAGAGPVGVLRAAQNIMGVTHILFQALENIVPSGAARALQANGHKGLSAYLWQVGGLCTGATALFCLLIALAPDWFFALFYGDSYSGYGYLLYWFTPIYLLISIGLPLRAGLRAMNNTRPIFVAYVLMTVFTLLSATLLIQVYGIYGAMIGILITQLILQGYIVNHFRSITLVK